MTLDIRHKLLISIGVLFLGLFIFSVFVFPNNDENNLLTNTLDSFTEKVGLNGWITVTTTGDFEGRSSLPHQGITEIVVYNKHNILYHEGQNMTRDCLAIGSCGAITTIALCNSTAVRNCTTDPTKNDSVDFFTEPVAGTGLTSGVGTVVVRFGANEDSDGNWSVSKTFTSTSVATVKINATRLQNATPFNFSGASFTQVLLENNDQLTINWTIGVD